MSKLIILDAGHGGRDKHGNPTTPGKRSPDGSMLEHDFNSRVADVMKRELEKYEGVRVVFVHELGRDVPLIDRTNKANELKADAYISLHANAFRGVMGNHTGIETYVHTSNPKESRQLADKLQAELVKVAGIANRGVKTENFHVLRETNMTAVLIEHGYMDSNIDLPKLKSDDFRVACAMANAKSVAEFFGLKRKPEPKPAPKANVLYKVQVGAFSSKEKAEAFAKRVQAEGFSTFIVEEEK
jgi:N-acetylmuramoyl-L-alanine amidase